MNEEKKDWIKIEEIQIIPGTILESRNSQCDNCSSEKKFSIKEIEAALNKVGIEKYIQDAIIKKLCR